MSKLVHTCQLHQNEKLPCHQCKVAHELAERDALIERQENERERYKEALNSH